MDILTRIKCTELKKIRIRKLEIWQNLTLITYRKFYDEFF